MIGVVFRRRRYDTGDRLEYLKTMATLAAERPDLAAPLLARLRDFLAALPRPSAVTPGGIATPARTVPVPSGMRGGHVRKGPDR